MFLAEFAEFTEDLLIHFFLIVVFEYAEASQARLLKLWDGVEDAIFGEFKTYQKKKPRRGSAIRRILRETKNRLE